MQGEVGEGVTGQREASPSRRMLQRSSARMTERHAWLVCCAQALQSCLTLCDARDCSPPGSSVHGILQASILEWVAISFSRGSS